MDYMNELGALLERGGSLTGAALLIAWAELRLRGDARLILSWARAIGARLGVTAGELADAARSPHPLEANLPAPKKAA